MNSNLVVLAVLFSTSTIMCFTLALAWQHFGRQRHVLLWAIAYGIGAVQWIFNAAGFFTGHVSFTAAASCCVLLSGSLIAIGARQRARLPIRQWQFVLGGGLALTGCLIANSAWGSRALQASIPAVYSGAMAIAAAFAIWPRQRSFSAPERAFFSTLLLFALFQFALTGLSLTIPEAPTSPALSLHRATLALGLPTFYIATGMTAAVLIAGDLSAQLRQMVSNDQLTGLLNRRGIDEAGTRAIANARRHGREVAAVICDMDDFKAVNDGHGHIVGDAALRAFARVLLGAVRQEDICARFGGDEFFVLLLDASEQDAAEVMERVRIGVEGLAVDRMRPGSISASFGVTSLRPGDTGLEDLVGRADQALYQSKQLGRNRVTIWQGSTTARPATPAEPLTETEAR